MSRRSITAVPLWTTDPFRRWVGYSAAAHVFVVVLTVVGPGWSAPSAPQHVFVDLVAAPELPKAKPRARRQVVDEAIVIPKQPRKTEARPKPKVEPKPEPVSAEEILAQLRAKVAKRSPKYSAPPTAREGRPDDPVLAAYRARVMSCLYEHWAGARAFSRQSELEVQFRVGIGSGGEVRRVSLARSSSNRYLDDSAERAIWSCNPFEPPPRGVSELNLTFNPADLV